MVAPLSVQIDIWILLASGLVVSLLLPRYWQAQVPIQGVPHSAGLLVLAFFTGAVCSSTGVVFTPYLATLPKSYTSTHTAGAGLSGLAIALLTLVADAGSLHPRLSPGHYFNLLSLVLLVGMAAFGFVSRRVHASVQEEREEARDAEPAAGVEEAHGQGQYGTLADRSLEETEERPDGDRRPLIAPGVDSGDPRDPPTDPSSSLPSASPPPSSLPSVRDSHVAVFGLQCLLSALAYGVVPSTLPMACTGYQNPSRVLLLANGGFMCADPLGKLATSFLPTGRIFMSGAATICLAALLLYCAFSGSAPPLALRPYGGVLVVVANTLFSFMFSFTSISIFFDRRRQEEAARARKAGRIGGDGGDAAYQWFAWSAFMVQTGAFLGTGLSLAGVLLWS